VVVRFIVIGKILNQLNMSEGVFGRECAQLHSKLGLRVLIIMASFSIWNTALCLLFNHVLSPAAPGVMMSSDCGESSSGIIFGGDGG
jgi:hypothetical protein